MKAKYYLTIIALVIFQSAVHSQTHTWTGNGGDNNWFNFENWNSGSVPSMDSDVFIPSGNTVEISTEAAAANSITIDNISTLIIENDLNLSDQISITINSDINWLEGVITGGIIENNGLIQIESLEYKKLIGVTLENNSEIYVNYSSQIKLSGGCVINNTETGTIEILSNGGLIQEEPGNTVNNEGSIRKLVDEYGSFGAFYMIFDMNNAGILEVDENQQFLFLGSNITLNNMETGVLKGFGAFDITSNFINLGTIAPGSEDSTGTLQVTNFLSLSPQAKLEFDIAGILAGEFDVIDVTGFPNLDGDIVVNLLFAPDIGDQFPVIIANEIMSCDFPEFVTTQFEGYDYTFEIICNSTSLVLKVVDIISQQIVLNPGYQFISSNLSSENPDMLEVLENNLNDNLDYVRNSQGQMLLKIGENWVNGIGAWISTEGYLFKMNEPDILIIDGAIVDPQTPINLNTGYQFISFLPNESMNAQEAFESILNDDLDFIRNSEGSVLRKIGPNWVNGIGECYTGEGFLIKMNGEGVLIYPMEP